MGQVMVLSKYGTALLPMPVQLEDLKVNIVEKLYFFRSLTYVSSLFWWWSLVLG